MNRGIVTALQVIAFGSFYTFWGIILYFMYSMGWWKIALLPTIILVLFAVALVNKVIAQRSAPVARTCPDCAETVLPDARVCAHCGFRFQVAA